MRIQIPNQAEWILEKIKSRGYEAFVVGGCVRDAILGREPGDWDITTSARPEQIKEIFGKTVDTGLQHGTVTVVRDHVGYEVTTYRIDGEYEDGRHPREVTFTSDLIEDLKRRDFTINAMAYSHETGVVDAFGGMDDLENHLIRCVGDPMERFTEDALRILRAVRFSAQLGFQIEEMTWNALSVIAPNLSHVSKERIQVELTKTLLSPYPERISLVRDTGMDLYISKTFPKAVELAPDLRPAAALRKDKALRWAAFLSAAGEHAAASVLKELKMDNDTTGKACMLSRWFGLPVPADKPKLRRMLSQMGPELFADLLALRAAMFPESEQEEKKAAALVKSILEDKDCLGLKDLAVNGSDLIEAGMKPGKGLGEALHFLLEQVLTYPEYNTKKKLLSLLAETPAGINATSANSPLNIPSAAEASADEGETSTKAPLR